MQCYNIKDARKEQRVIPVTDSYSLKVDNVGKIGVKYA